MSIKKSVQQLKAEGTYRPDKHGHREQETGALLTELPPAPVKLSKEAGAIYEQEGAGLIAQKMLKATDVRTLAAYAVEMSVYFSEMREAEKEGVVSEMSNGTRGTNPHRKNAEAALKLAGALSDKLGLSPAARHRIKGAGAFLDDKPKEESLIFQMMHAGKRKSV